MKIPLEKEKYSLFFKILFFMKLIILILCFTAAQASAIVYGQTINLSVENVSFEEALIKISKQSKYDLVYDAKVLRNTKPTSVYLKDSGLENALRELFRDQPLKYTLSKNTIVVQARPIVNMAVKPIEEVIQQEEISGRVTDEDGEALVGVSVRVKGTNRGATTNISGQFAIQANKDDILVFSYIGFLAQEARIIDLASLEVVLRPDNTSLEEVVVVGYGTEKAVSITGSISSINSKEIESITSSNLVTGLAGKLPGLRVTQRTGEPGSFSTAFDIRGYGSPLIVVDGIVRNDFNKLDPNSIESITVLKDASAAVYGVKAANGVMLITTKKGRISKPAITYSANYELQKFATVPELTDAYQFAVLTTENEIGAGSSPGSTTYSPEDIQKFKDGTYPSTDWLGAISRKNTDLIHHNVSISGGDEKVKYFTSLGYLGETGVWKSNNLNYKRYNLQSSVTVAVTSNLKAQLNVDGMLEDRNNTSLSASNIFFTAMLAQPTLPLYANDNPEYLQLVNPENVMADIDPNRSGYAKTKNKTFQGNFSLDYTFKDIEGLNARFMYGFNSQDMFQKEWRKQYNVYTYDKVSDTYTVAGSGKWTPTSLYEDYFPLQKTTLLGQLTYDRLFLEKHQVKATVIYEGRHAKSDNLNVNKQFAIDVDQLYAGLSQNATVNSSNIYEDANESIIGRLNYDYLSKYIFEAGFNYGGSSKFPKGKRWGLFPFSSVGWRISEEGFMKESLPYVTNLKLRGSWGQMGDDAAANYQYLTGYNYPNGNYIFGTDVIPSLGFRGLPNPNITWFTATTKNIGVDLDISHGLLSMQFDLFQRNRSGLLATRILSLPATIGANLPQENLNKDEQNGFEIVLGHRKTIGELSYMISANLTYTRDMNTHVDRSPDGNSYLDWRNNSTDRWKNIQWGYEYIGQFQNYEEILSSPIQDGQGNRTLRPGDLKYEDINRDGMINGMDQSPIAKGNIPSTQFGLNITLSWKNFDVGIFAQGATDYSYRYNGMNSMPLRWSRNSLTQFMDRWHHEDIFDTNSPLVPGFYPQTGYVDSDNWTSSFWLSNGSYVRLKNVEIGYTFKQSVIQKIGIQSMRVNLNASNLYTWTNLRNIDPEQQQDFFYSYPLNRSLSMGLSVTF